MAVPKNGSKRPDQLQSLTTTSSRSTKNWNKSSQKNSSANPVRSENPFKMSALVLLCLISGGQCSFHKTPLNVAKRIGDTVVMRCCINEDVSQPCENLTWKRQVPTSSETDIILTSNKVSNTFSDHISLGNQRDRGCDLKIKVRTSSAGTYECVSRIMTSAEETASAEMVVLVAEPECVVKTNDESYTVACSVGYVGNWAPEIIWTGQDGATIKATASDSPSGEVRRTVILPRIRTGEKEITYYKCTVKFTRKERPEGITATNVPDYTWTMSLGAGK